MKHRLEGISTEISDPELEVQIVPLQAPLQVSAISARPKSLLFPKSCDCDSVSEDHRRRAH